MYSFVNSVVWKKGKWIVLSLSLYIYIYIYIYIERERERRTSNETQAKTNFKIETHEVIKTKTNKNTCVRKKTQILKQHRGRYGL